MMTRVSTALVLLSLCGSARAAAMDVQELARRLGRQGSVVQQGSMYFFRIEDCRALKMCYGNNPASPYGLYVLPPAPGQPEIPSRLSLPGITKGTPSWRLRPDEAVVFIGRTPPAMKYFSFRSYLFSRRMRNGQRRDLFASLGDALNHVRIASSGTPGGRGGDPFDRDTVVITTADRAMDGAIREALAGMGISRDIMNTDELPSTLPLDMGLEEERDEFVMLFRVSHFQREADERAYLASQPGVVLRITPARPRPIDPFPVPALRPHGTGERESDRVAGLEKALDRLEKDVRARHPDHVALSLPVRALERLQGFNCIEKNMPCLGDVSDTVYMPSIWLTWLKPGDGSFLMMLGVNHVMTGKASYAGVSVYDAKRVMGVGGFGDFQMKGSAEYWGAAGAPPELFAYKIARDCPPDTPCYAVPSEFPGVAASDPMFLMERAYLEQTTGTGPSYAELTRPRVLLFKPRRGRPFAGLRR